MHSPSPDPPTWRVGHASITAISVGLGIAIFDWLGSWVAYGRLLWEDWRLGCDLSPTLLLLVGTPPVLVLCGSVALRVAYRSWSHPAPGLRRVYMIATTLFWVLLPLGIVMAWGALSAFGRRTGLC